MSRPKRMTEFRLQLHRGDDSLTVLVEADERWSPEQALERVFTPALFAMWNTYRERAREERRPPLPE